MYADPRKQLHVILDYKNISYISSYCVPSMNEFQLALQSERFLY
jgi:hypothetical protein